MIVPELARFAEIVSINLLLSGDNAILVGMAVVSLPEHQRQTAAFAGVAAACVLQIIATVTLASFLQFPGLSLVGGLLLEWIAIRFLNEDRSAPPERTDAPGALLNAIAAVLVAYVIVSLDNVMAVAAVGRGYPFLLAAGLAVSCAIVIPGSILIAQVMRRFPPLLFVGAGLLGWTAGGLVASDPICGRVLHYVGGIRASNVALIASPIFFTVLAVVSPWLKGCGYGTIGAHSTNEASFHVRAALRPLSGRDRSSDPADPYCR